MPAVQTSSVRRAAVAGMFYSDDTEELRASVDQLLESATPVIQPGELVGIIVPHAGHVYSGLTAAYAYRLLQGRTVGTVIAVGPSHREYFDGVSVYPGRAYETPLGEIPIDTGMRELLVSSGIVATAAGHRQEHSLEVQLPFLQRTLGSFSLVPLVMGTQVPSLCHALAKAIADAARGKSVLLLASSDLSHFHPYEEAVEMDGRVAGLIARYDTAELLERLERETAEACGGGPIVAVMEAARLLGADHSRILHTSNSGEVSGDRHSVVGYLSAGLTRGN
jgi:MEMO1 family protein